MRIAIVSDIHGNLTAFEAVLAALHEASPDLILQGGDLPHGGSAPAEVLDRVRDLGWPSVAGNTDEMLFDPQSLKDFANQSPNLKSLWDTIAEMAAATMEALGRERIEWLKGLPRKHIHDSIALVHASPDSTWRSPSDSSSDAELESTYSPQGHPIVVYGHIHRPFIRRVGKMTVINTGSVSMSYDGDPRASYLLLDDGKPSIRRVDYDVDKEIKALATSGLPHFEWIARTLKSAKPEMP